MNRNIGYSTSHLLHGCLPLEQILKAVRRHGQATALELGCSDAYIHVRLKKAGLTLKQVLRADNLNALLPAQYEESTG